MLSNFAFFGTAEIQRIERKLDKILSALALNTGRETIMALNIDALKTAVANEEVSIDRAIAMLQQESTDIAALKQQLADAIAAQDPAALQAVVDQITADQGKVDAAIAALQTNPPPSAASRQR